VGPRGLGGAAQAADDGFFPSGLDIQEVEDAAIGEDQVARIGAPDRAFARRDDARATAVQVHDGYRKRAAFADIERDLAAIGRPIGLRAVPEAGGDALSGAAGGRDTEKLRATMVVVGVNDFITDDSTPGVWVSR